MNTQAKVALDKEKHPERYCKAKRCLWKVVQLDHAAQTYSPRPDCPDGYCPRHRPVTLRSPLVYPHKPLECSFDELEPIQPWQKAYERDREDRAVRG